MGANIPAGLMWKTMSGEFVQMTQTLAGQIFAAAAAQDAALFAYCEQVQGHLASAEQPEAIDIESGWPETYGGA